MLNIGIDFHDTISYNSQFFKSLMRTWDGVVFVVTGTPQSQKCKTIEQLNKLLFLILMSSRM